MNEELTIRFAVREDAPALLRLTQGLAASMGREGAVAATPADIVRGMFDEGAGERCV